FFFSSRRRHTRCLSDWSSDVCSSDLGDVLLDHRPRRGIGRHVIDRAAAHEPDLAPVAQGLAVFGAGAHQLFGGGVAAGAETTRRGASGAAGMLLTSIGGIGVSIARNTALAS